MNTCIKDWITETFADAFSHAVEVGEVITDYFGEDLVDVQLPDMEEEIMSNLSGIRLNQCLQSTVRNDGNVCVGSTDAQIIVPREDWLVEGSRELLNLSDELLEKYHDVIINYLTTIGTRIRNNKRVNIIIRFPKVTVTNENDKSIDITELYAKVTLKYSGKIYEEFQLFRAEYTTAQYLSGYAHSHMPDTAPDWRYPCLGEGPIVSTQYYLAENFNLEMWGLFCYELSKYVTVESLAGVPYRRLEDVGRSTNIRRCFFPTNRQQTLHRIIRTFLRYYVRTQKFPVAYAGGSYILGCHPIDFLTSISKTFIEWFNKRHAIPATSASNFTLNDLVDENVIGKYIIKDKTLWYSIDRGYCDMSDLQGMQLFIFKGNWVTMNFIDREEEEDNNQIFLLNPDAVSNIMQIILRVINYNYGHKECNQTAETTTRQRHIFL